MCDKYFRKVKMKLFDGKGDARGILARFSKSLKSSRDKFKGKSKSGESLGETREESDADSESTDPTVEGIANSFIQDGDLEGFSPRGHADMSIRGATDDAALDLDFSYDEDPQEPQDSQVVSEGEDISFNPEKNKEGTELHPNINLPSQQKEDEKRRRKSVDSTHSQGSGIPKLTIAMLVCGTRGDVQPFIALGIKLKEFGHRVRIATHQDYRDFVTKYGLEFYPLGGDPKILSDFIVKHRGVFTVNTKDALENINQVEEIVFSSYDACTQPDPGDKKKRSFVAQAIIANPPSYGHIHVAEKMKIPCHIFFTMPWTPTRNFPHPLARISNVRDTRPSSIALRNYLSYLMVNEYTYTGLFAIFNRFREEKLHLEPIRFGSSGATLLDAHDVPFAYCWSPSLIKKPQDWDDHIDVTGYFFLNEGSRGKYKPSKELASFLEHGPPPVYLGFGSLMVDDRERLTQKILDAFKETGQRLLMSKGWAELGEGFDLPDSVMLLDDVPHDWLLPKCSGAIHHGGAGTTAASLLAACPTLVIPFFGDQQFWGSAIFRRGVGPKPIPIDKLTTKKLVQALNFMNKPEVKAEAEKISAQIKSEDGVQNGMDAFHRHLPLQDLKAGKPTDWNLAKPTLGSFVHELAGGIGDIFWLPVKGAKTEGVKGAFKGVGKGVFNSVARPLKGAGLAGFSVWHSVSGSKEYPKCLSIPETKSFTDKDIEEYRKEKLQESEAVKKSEETAQDREKGTQKDSAEKTQKSDSETQSSDKFAKKKSFDTGSLFKRRFMFNNPKKDEAKQASESPQTSTGTTSTLPQNVTIE